MKHKLHHIVITANGKGERMARYTVPKFMLPYKGKPILKHLCEKFPAAVVLTHHNVDGYPVYSCQPTDSRSATLSYLKGWKNVLVVDSDIVVLGNIETEYNGDTLYMREGINAGLYFIADVNQTLEKMQGDEIANAMAGADVLQCETIHLGTEKEYEYYCS